MEPYLKVNYTVSLCQRVKTMLNKITIVMLPQITCRDRTMAQTKVRGRWLKPKLDYNDRLGTLCESRDIEDDYHIILICTQYSDLRRKYINSYYYVNPSMHKFINYFHTHVFPQMCNQRL